MRTLAGGWRLVAAMGAVGLVTVVYSRWLPVSGAATVSLTFLMVVLVVAATSPLWMAVATSLAAMLCLNFFFLPPVGTFTIADPQNWVALFAFIVVSLVASNLSAVARARTHEALGRRDELARLFDLSRDVLVMTESPEAISILARSIARRFDLEFVGIALPRGDDWSVFTAGPPTIVLEASQLAPVFAKARTSLEFDAYARTYAGHGTVQVEGHGVRLVPLRAGTKPIGLLAASGRPVEAGTLDTLAGVVAIAIERAQFLGERRAAALTRQSEELKTALLASLGHDLRTPLTAIRIAAANLQASWLTPDDRREQSDLILTEVGRLTRLFENVLEMARIDAGAVAADARWVHPSEIVAAARDLVGGAMAQTRLEVQVDPDVPVLLDPRLTATALAHVLENAARYGPAGSAIRLSARLTGEELTIQVSDTGPGIAPGDLPHLFERFYRGAGAKTATGTGMGLWIARGLLAAQQGRIWAENAPGGGARFTIAVPVGVREDVADAAPTT
jgi:two-component system sensor histidine kinase KdpD